MVVGKDMRHSSNELAEQLIKGITGQGANVIDIGLCSTPINYYANGVLKADASVMVTASHNPSGWNGFKISREKAIPLSGDTGIMDIKDKVIKNDFKSAEKPGSVKKRAILGEYCTFVKNHFHPNQRKLKMVADCGNAMGVYELKSLNLPGIEILPMYDELDGGFPNHEANPLKHETLVNLQKRVKNEKADLGVAFDGDGDRIGIVDEKGEIIRNDFLTALIAEDVLTDKKGAKIFYDLRSSKIVKETIEKSGGRALMCRVGHAFIKEEMKQENALFAGELSGHYYFQENFNAESSALAVVRIINLLLKTGKPISDLAEKLKLYYQSGEINREVRDKDTVLKKLEKNYKDGRIYRLDGLSIEYKHWWCNVRPSNTEPLLRLNIEANTKKLMEQKRDEILAFYD